MKELEKVVQEEVFDVEVQYCNPDDCQYDCLQEGTNHCNAVLTGFF